MPDLATLEAENGTLLAFLYLCPVGVVQLAADGVVQMINPHAAQLMMPVSSSGSIVNFFMALEGCAPELRNLAGSFPVDRGYVVQGHRIVVGGSGPGPRFLSCSLLKINADCLVAVLQDVSREVQQEQRLKQNEAMFSAIVTDVNDFALFSLDEHGRIDSWNLSAMRQTGYAAEDVLGRDLDNLVGVDSSQTELMAEQVVAAAQEGWSLREARFIRRAGRRYWCQILVAAMEGAEGRVQGYSVVMRDVTERRMTSEELRRLVTTDHLTGAANRAHFFEQAAIAFDRSKRSGRPLSVIMLDVDHFKSVNDAFGHAGGDAVLQALVQQCKRCLDEADVLARLGGEEFAVLLPNADRVKAALVAERMRYSVATLNGPPVNVTISLGCAQIDNQVGSVDALLRQADEALYKAKRAGRDQVVVALALPDLSDVIAT